jgi:hypothetical protein
MICIHDDLLYSIRLKSQDEYEIGKGLENFSNRISHTAHNNASGDAPLSILLDLNLRLLRDDFLVTLVGFAFVVIGGELDLSSFRSSLDDGDAALVELETIRVVRIFGDSGGLFATTATLEILRILELVTTTVPVAAIR